MEQKRQQHLNNTSDNNISSSSSSSSPSVPPSPSYNYNSDNDWGKCGFIFHILVIVLGLLYYSNVLLNHNNSNNIVTTKKNSSSSSFIEADDDAGIVEVVYVDDDNNDNKIIILVWSLIIPTIILCAFITVLLSLGAMNIVYAMPSNYTAIETIHDTYQIIQQQQRKQQQRKQSTGRHWNDETNVQNAVSDTTINSNITRNSSNILANNTDNIYKTEIYDNNSNNNDNPSTKTNAIIIQDIIDLDVSFINDLVSLGEGEM